MLGILKSQILKICHMGNYHIPKPSIRAQINPLMFPVCSKQTLTPIYLTTVINGNICNLLCPTSLLPNLYLLTYIWKDTSWRLTEYLERYHPVAVFCYSLDIHYRPLLEMGSWANRPLIWLLCFYIPASLKILYLPKIACN